MLFYSDGQRDAAVRRANAMINRGDDAEILTTAAVRKHTHTSILIAPVFQFMAGYYSVVPEQHAMTRWPGVRARRRSARCGSYPELRS